MANRNSQQIINANSQPIVLSNAHLGVRANVRGAFGTVQVLTTDVANDIFRMFSVPSNAMMRSLRYFCSALGGSATADIGVYRTLRDGGAVVDRDYFSTALSLVTAIGAGTECVHESGSYSLARREQPLWQALGGGLYTQDPNIWFDIAFTLNVATAVDGPIGLEASYCD